MADPRTPPGIGDRASSSSFLRPRSRLAAILLVVWACGASRAWAESCGGFADDRAYLSEVDVIVEKSTRHPGETVTVRRRSDRFLLRQIWNGESFYEDPSHALTVTYTIIPQCGGFDVRYTISNLTSQPHLLPDLRVDGLRQAEDGDIYLLNTKDYGNVQRINNPDGTVGTSFMDQPYPTWLYSPVIVSHDSNAAFGSALLYPVLQPRYRLSVRPILQRVVSDGSWMHLYHHFTEETGAFPEGPPSTVPAGEARQFTVTVRFSKPRYWLLTLFPYKQYFSSLYWHDADPRRPDLRPVFVSGVNYGGPLSLYQLDWQSNPRAYRNDYRVDLEGWHRFVTDTIRAMRDNGYSRVMTWAPGGLYNVHISDFNFPPQFMSDWLPMVFNTQSELRAYGLQGITLGYWWGRSTQIPRPVQWNPPGLVSAQYSNPDHRAFLTREVTLARDRGGQEIGLDYFFEMPLYDRFRWIDDMKALAPGVNFIHEGAGPDVMSLKMSQFYQTPHPGGHVMEAPDVLSAYLLPHRPEIWVYLGHTTEPQELINPGTIQKLVRWGFTPVVSKYPHINVSDLVDTPVPCFDGIDNDGDGLTDWPYDPGCATAAGDSEQAASKLAVTRTGGERPIRGLPQPTPSPKPAR